MSIAFVQKNADLTSVSATAAYVDCSSLNTAHGNTLVCFVTCWCATPGDRPLRFTFSDTYNNEWSVYARAQSKGDRSGYAAIAVATNIVGGANHVVRATSNSPNGMYVRAGVAEFSGVHPSSAWDVAESDENATSSHSSLTVTTPATSENGELVLACFCGNANDTEMNITTPTGFTQAFYNGNGSAVIGHQSSYKLGASIGTQTATWSYDAVTGAYCDAVVLSLKEQPAVETTGRIFEFPLQKWSRQPQSTSGVDPSWGLRPTLAWLGSLPFADVATGGSWVRDGATSQQQTPAGKTVRGDGSTAGFLSRDGGATTAQTACTMVAVARLQATAAGVTACICSTSYHATVSAGFILGDVDETGNARIGIDIGNGGVAQNVYVSLVTDRWYAIVASIDTVGDTCYVMACPLVGGEVLYASGAYTGTPTQDQANGTYVIGLTKRTGNEMWNGDIAMVVAAFQYLSPDIARQLVRRPWSLFSARRPMFVATSKLPAAAIQMPAIQRKSQPKVRAGINTASSLTRGLIRLYNFARGGIDETGNWRGTWEYGSGGKAGSSAGFGVRINTDTETVSSDSTGAFTGDVSVVLVVESIQSSLPAANWVMVGDLKTTWTADYNWAFAMWNSSDVRFQIAVQDVTPGRQSGIAVDQLAYRTPTTYVGTWGGSSGADIVVRIYSRSGASTSNGSFSGSRVGGATTVRGAYWAPGRAPDIIVPLVGVWNRMLSADEAMAVVRNPWQLFAPQRRILIPQPGAVISRSVLDREIDGWGASTGAVLSDTIDEASYQDSDYIKLPI